MFDEAQDADPIMLNVLNNQSAQVIYVGDRHQQIYAFRGAVNAMQSLEIPETRLSQSFRFGQDIADLANTILFNVLDEEIPLRGFEQIESQVCEVHDSVLMQLFSALMPLRFHTWLSLFNCSEPRLEVDTGSLIKNIEDAKKLKQVFA